MELRQIEYFLAVSRCRNFTRAAQALYVTQPTITIAIKNLEKELGLTLFNRTRGDLTLTHEGEAFLGCAQKIMNDIENAFKTMSELNPEHRDTLSIGIPTITCAAVYPIVLNDFSSLHPDVAVQISDYGNLDILREVGNGELELGFISLPNVLEPHLEKLPIFESEVSVIMSDAHPFSRLASVDICDLAQEDIVMYFEGISYTERKLKEEFEKRGLELHVRHRIKHSVTLFEMVAQNHGVSVILNRSPEAVNSHPNIVIKPFREPIRHQIGLIWNRNTFLSTSARLFIDFIHTFFGKEGQS